MHFQMSGYIVKGLAIAGLLCAFMEQSANAQCGNRSMTGGQQNPRTQQYGMQQPYGFGQPMGGQQNPRMQQNGMQQQFAMQQFAMQQFAMQQQYALQQQNTLQQQPSSQNSQTQQLTANSPSPQVTVARVRQTEVYFPTMRFDTTESNPPIDPIVAKERDAKYRLSVIKTLVSTWKHDDALRFADQLVYNYPNSPQAAEAKAIIKSLTKND